MSKINSPSSPRRRGSNNLSQARVFNRRALLSSIWSDNWIPAFAGMTIVFLLLTTLPSYAIDSTPSADIQSKLEQLKQEIASKAATIKGQITKKLENKAYFGVVQELSNINLDLQTSDGLKKITLNQDTLYENANPKAKNFNFGGLKKEATIAALGDIDDMNSLVARKIVLLPTPTTPKIHLWGQIISLSGKSLTLKDKNASSSAITFDSETTFQKGDNEVDSTDIKKSDMVIVSGILSPKGILDAYLIYIIAPISTSPSPSPIPSPSQTSSPSASPKR